MDISKQARKLIKNQIAEWPLAGRNYKGLENVQTRKLDFDSYEILIQFNQERIRSSAAKVDAKSIEARPCFLCRNNLPIEQRGIPVLHDYLVLVNPFPIFPEHLTIPHMHHIDQRIKGKFEDMLKLAKSLNDFVVFYNGPKCGASAPDHFHFQAGIKGFMPIETDFLEKSKDEIAGKVNNIEIFHWNNYGRSVVSLKGSDNITLVSFFDKFYSELLKIQPDDEEPMLNILCYKNNDDWVVHLFPRKLHRPRQYFEKGKHQIILSPASVDLGGVLITPREEDYNKITHDDVEDIFRQVCLSQQNTELLLSSMI